MKTEPGEGDRGGDSSPRPTLELRLPIRRRSPDHLVSPWPRWIFTIAVTVATFVACLLWIPPEVPDRVVEAVRASAIAARD